MTTLALDPFGSPQPPRLPIHDAGPPPDPAVLERNLAALARASARTAELVRYSAPRSDLRFLRTDDGVPSVETIDPIGLAPARALASRRRPLREGEQLVESIDVATTAAVAVMGFGAGYHVAALARRLRRTGVIAVFEPDIALLRAVLERIDHSAWLAESNTAIFTDPDDAAAITASLSGVEGIVMMGLSLVEHAPSLVRLGDSRTRFYRNFQDVVAAVRTTVATTMVQVRTTVANVMRNLPWYVTARGVADLAGSRAATPAIVVSAGPSLQRNIEQLSRPGVRERFTIIAAQTVLRPLLARGIRPHYVVALDHSEISARFYEGLTAADVEGVTLVVEPKVSPAVPLAFPGEVRLARDPFLDMLLGSELGRDMGSLLPGATVAHLAYYLARHLGADPVVLVGQDLGFTDAQYYAAGAAIHDVWACEINQFNSLERMEWERIKRMGSNLRRATDHLGRDIFTDEQLATYLVQFERDFLADTRRGMTIIDATEGGVAKRHTRAEPLAAVVDRVLASPERSLPASPPAPAARTSLRRAEEHLRGVQRDVHRVGELSRKTFGLLNEMLANHADQRRVSRLIDEVHRVRDEVEGAKPAIDLVHFLNQAGAFSRIRADRSIQLDPSLTPLQRQRREIERDIANVELLARTAEELTTELAAAADLLVRWQHERPTRIATADASRCRVPASHTKARGSATAHAILAVPCAAGFEALGWRDALRLTLRRLDRVERLESIVLLAEDPESVSAAVEGLGARLPLRILHTGELYAPSHRQVRAARAGAAECWRAGLAGASVYDEVLAPEATLQAMTDLSIDAALITGHDWCFIDPELCDSVIERGDRAAGTHRLAISQAPPGGCGVLMNRSLLTDLIKLRRGASPFATIGGLIAYLPTAPTLDPIGRGTCAPIDPALRDLGLRLIPDSPARAAFLAQAVEALGGQEKAAAATRDELLRVLGGIALESTLPPTSLTLGLSQNGALSAERLLEIASEFTLLSPGGLLTLRADASAFGTAAAIAVGARATGSIFVHLRTTIRSAADAEAVSSVGADIVSVDLPSRPQSEEWDLAHRAIETLVELSRAESIDGRPRTWIVPRLTKSDATLGVLEGFFDRWLLTTGATAIDPLPVASAGERITPLPLSAITQRRLARTCLYVRDDASMHAEDTFDRSSGSTPVADLTTATLADGWRQVIAARKRNEERR